MTKEQKEWLGRKKLELLANYHAHGSAVNSWDAAQFFEILGSLERKIRRLETQLAAKI